MTHTQNTLDQAPETSGLLIKGWLARFYDLFDLIGTNKVRRATVRAGKVQPGEAVLDVGCGTGTLALLLEEPVGPKGRVEGIDASLDMLARARKKLAKRHSRANVQPAVAEDLPFGDGEFDLVTSTYVFHHLPDDLRPQALAEIKRVLKPGGRVLIVDLAGGPHSFVGFLMSVFGHAHGGYAEGLEAQMKDAGFSGVRRLRSKKFKSEAFIRGTV